LGRAVAAYEIDIVTTRFNDGRWARQSNSRAGIIGRREE